MKKKENRMAERFLISMPKAFLERVNAFAEKESRCRSELVREALRFYMESKE